MGGNVFDLSSPIKKEFIKPTLNKFYEELKSIFPLVKESHFTKMVKLGSVGKKDSSGDIDLALSSSAFNDIIKKVVKIIEIEKEIEKIEKKDLKYLDKEKILNNLKNEIKKNLKNNWGLDVKYIKEKFEQFAKRARTATQEQLMRRAVITAMGEKIEEQSDILAVSLKSSGAGSIFFAFPQFDEQGEQTEFYVQIDVNVGDVDWLSFAYYSDEYKDNVKGLHRTQLMLSLFLIKGYSFSHNSGVTNKETGEIEANSPQQAIDLLNRLYNFQLDSSTLQNYFKLQDFLKANLSSEELNKLYSAYIMILDRTRTDIPIDLQKFWIDNQERLGLKGKFLPDDSKLKQYATVQ